MAHRMLGFVHTEMRMPDKRSAEERRHDFNEIYPGFHQDRAGEQAGRCSQCGVPFCQVHCPLHNNIPDWLRFTAEGRLEEAYEIASATNTFPEICGRICPQDRLCEGNCTIEQSRHGTVTIGTIERYITDTAFEKGWVKPRLPLRERDQSVGIIGAGPAGLAAAEMLRAKGYSVDVYDRHDRMGGLMIYGIPSFKLEKFIVLRRIAWLEEQGVRFHPGTDVGRNITLAELRQRHDAVLIATGVYKARDIRAPGSTLDGIVPALDYLIANNRVGLGDTVVDYESGRLKAAGKDVVVIGGGDTAMDCVRTAIRQGAKSVKCVYRRDRRNMPGSQREVSHAEEEGVELVWQTAPEAFHGDSRVQGMLASRIHLGVVDAAGRQTPQPVPGSEFTLPADLVIKALGFEPEDLPILFGDANLKVTRWGTVSIDFRTMMTSLDGVFAAGDIVRGASLVVWGIRDGRDVAEHIHTYLRRKAQAATANPVATAA
ncbi:NAD(P)-dependent oxidoreductase [Indioceanicola profundi]|uniref:NAD(P)-dependent oxidoreductase n=1 Tax=Indioceanicola profundi TaxID=2220096 RepID=UPI000E6AA885|nr:NAD(P)-dependent oxidoreductase [Indioceanicola profundi]